MPAHCSDSQNSGDKKLALAHTVEISLIKCRALARTKSSSHSDKAHKMSSSCLQKVDLSLHEVELLLTTNQALARKKSSTRSQKVELLLSQSRAILVHSQAMLV
ncbi:hypothetical protein PanWU01x14_134080 [Parasponia andersonii]|uniref:Uncharacterized protein n=1 Tax=Parasponia andersonii TaxID=3476 RepID=A0A2P5CQ52_PARAD|nr:hypothetical protein PanWU01x14_134080 [Parasponia andersonii]